MQKMYLIVAVIVFVIVAGFTGHFLWNRGASAEYGNEPYLHVDADGDEWQCVGEPTVGACEMQPNEGNAIYEPLGYPSRTGALANCADGVVNEIWRKGKIAGWACVVDMTPGGSK